MKRLVVPLLAFLSVLPSGHLAAQASEPEVTELGFEGNESFSDQALASSIVTRQSECRSVILQPFCIFGADWAQEPYFLNPRSFARDVARIRLFYYERGYREATVDTAVVRSEPGRVRVTFRIQEGRPVRVDSLSFSGLEAVADSESVVESVPLGVGDPLSGILMDATRDTIRARLQNRGYARAEVLRNYFIGRDDPYSAQVGYDVYAGTRAYIGPMTVVGNQVTSEQVIRRMLPFSEGSLYNQNLIFEAQRNLYNLEIFTHAEIRSDLESEPDSAIPLRIQVNEGDVHRVRTGAGWNNGECANAEGRWVSRNFFGGARRLQIRGRVSNVFAERFSSSLCNQAGTGEFGRLNWLVSTDFNQPWIFSPRNALNLGIFGERQSLKGIYVRTAVGATGAITRNVGRRQNLTVSFRPELSELDAAEIFFCTGFQVCAPEDIDVLSGANWLSPVAVSYSQDRTDQVLNPTAGYSFRAELEHASEFTGSNYAYHRAVGEVSGYWSVTPGTVLAARVRGGWLDPLPFEEELTQADGLQIAHPEKRFFSGGSNSVRGYAENQLGPRNLSVPVEDLVVPPADTAPALCTPEEIINLTCDAGQLADDEFTQHPTGGSQLLEGNVELRFPFVGSQSQAVVFVDYGYVWPEPGRISLKDLRFTPGIGFRYFTPIGPLRVDLGYQLETGDQLNVVTDQIRPVEPGESPIADGVPYVKTDDLALLQPSVVYDDIDSWLAINRLQLQLSLGQAF